MEKEEIKKTTTKTTPKKTTTVKKAAVKKEEPKKKTTTKKPKVPMVKCRYCSSEFEEGLTICPVCKKNQKDQTGKFVIGSLLVILLFSLTVNHFIYKRYNNPLSEEEYKINSTFVSYEDLVRKPKDYKNKDVKIIGTVKSVKGKDTTRGNVMTITMNSNLFSGENEHLINFEYVDTNYELGFIEGDLITVYGKYLYINGNNPFVLAKYITFGS